jgi:hypothetical protein
VSVSVLRWIIGFEGRRNAVGGRVGTAVVEDVDADVDVGAEEGKVKSGREVGYDDRR